MIETETKEEVGGRLARTREALDALHQNKWGNTVRHFAAATGVTERNLSNWENGVSYVPLWYVSRLKELFGVTYDWIYHGDPSGLRHDLHVMLTRPARR